MVNLLSYLGIVAVVKGSYGFIKRDRERNDKTANESRIFFHLSEMLDANAKTGRRRVKKGCEVEFTVLEVGVMKSRIILGFDNDYLNRIQSRKWIKKAKCMQPGLYC